MTRPTTTWPLVVGVDGSDGSQRAVDWAADEAARHGLPLRLVYASLWEHYEAGAFGEREHQAERRLAEHIVAAAAERAARRAPGVKIDTDVVPEEPADALLREAGHAFAVVTGTRGHGALTELLLGSVGRTVADHAEGPVIVVRGDRAGLAGTHARILLGAGEPGTAADAVRFAFHEAEARKCTLDVVRAWHCPVYESAEFPAPSEDPSRARERQAAATLDALLQDAIAEHPRVRVRRATVRGSARRTLLRRSAAADLVVIGACRSTGPFGPGFGHAGHALLRHAACPVAVVPHRR
ncbi:universal stress protein [Streptomyces sp. NPDC001508]|uniref:universal stress protein n=1 Tax=Streptomyces sp. NPDC001508 TaxID=3154656 RepID=UPI00331B1C10